MSIKTILTTIALVAGSSTAALARPVTVGHGPVVRDHRAYVNTQIVRHVMPRYSQHERYEHRWYGGATFDQNYGNNFYVAPAPVTYVAPTTTYVEPSYVEPTVVSAGQTSQFLPLGQLTGNGIQLSLAMGEDQAFVDQVVIHYADGRQVPLHLDQSLTGYNPTIDLQTEACAISGVTVIGRGAVSAIRI